MQTDETFEAKTYSKVDGRIPKSLNVRPLIDKK
jgi:hypothetical protein